MQAGNQPPPTCYLKFDPPDEPYAKDYSTCAERVEDDGHRGHARVSVLVCEKCN